MLECGHDRARFGDPMCEHIGNFKESCDRYVRWYTGTGLMKELICLPCAKKREMAIPVNAGFVCEECFESAMDNSHCLKSGGKPEVKFRSESFNNAVKETSLSNELGPLVDIAPINDSENSTWLLLQEDGRISRFDADTGKWTVVAFSTVPSEPNHDAFCGHELRRRLCVSSGGEFAAVVNDYGRFGQVIDLGSGKITLSLDGGTYCSYTVPFSFTFATVDRRVVAVHRTDWNRLDISDPATGELLTERGPTRYEAGENRPEHYLDYFHGALYVDPTGTLILDDGWIWHPVGVPTSWNLATWLGENAWESEGGSTKTDICGRAYYWDHGITWLDNRRVVVGGIGDDDNEIIDGARIFDVTSREKASGIWSSRDPSPIEIIRFPGPGGKFFSDGVSLYNSNGQGLSRWDTNDGARTGHLENFHPTHHHRGANELVQLIDGNLVRWSTN